MVIFYLPILKLGILANAQQLPKLLIYLGVCVCVCVCVCVFCFFVCAFLLLWFPQNKKTNKKKSIQFLLSQKHHTRYFIKSTLLACNTPKSSDFHTFCDSNFLKSWEQLYVLKLLPQMCPMILRLFFNVFVCGLLCFFVSRVLFFVFFVLYNLCFEYLFP